MPRRPALITQADVARVTRAAKQCDADRVEVRPDGSIFIHMTKEESVEKPAVPVEPERKVVL
jgi:hypothetical protein